MMKKIEKNSSALSVRRHFALDAPPSSSCLNLFDWNRARTTTMVESLSPRPSHFVALERRANDEEEEEEEENLAPGMSSSSTSSSLFSQNTITRRLDKLVLRATLHVRPRRRAPAQQRRRRRVVLRENDDNDNE